MIPRSLWKWLVPVLALAVFGAGCGGDDDTTASGGEDAPEGPTIRVRGQDFSENITMAEVYGQYLEAKGYDVDILTAAGYRTEALDALESGDIDLVIDYIGGDQTALAPDTTTSSDPDEVVAVIEPLLADLGATLLDHSEASSGDALVVRGDSEAESISDLVGLDYVFGGASECYERPQCYLGFTDPEVYGIDFADTRTIEFGPLLGENLAAEEVDVVMWGTTAPQIEEQGFKILEDDQGLFPAQNIAPIIRTEVLDAYGEQLRADLDELSALITTDDLVDWNRATDVERRESDDVAREWLEENDLL
jgi:osmoprotectant transport system substrate-binding protein